jgi:hypothetical protein
MPENQETQLNPFEKLYKKKLSSDEQEEAESNLYGFLSLLIEMDREQKERKDD